VRIAPGEGRQRRVGRIWLIAALLFGAPIAYAAVFALASAFAQYSPAPKSISAGQFRGAYHVHSTASDGKGTPEQIAKAAREAGIQFVVLTDHNVESIPPPRIEAGVLLIFGVEVSSAAGHVVALGSRALTSTERSSNPIHLVHRIGGHTVVAHPIQRKRPWTDWEAAREADGLELYSADSMLRSSLAHPLGQMLPALGAYLVNRRHGLMLLVQDQPEARQKLIGLSSEGPKVALCALDAHGWPAYQTEFELLSMYLPAHPEWSNGWPADPKQAAREVISDLVSGRAYCGFNALGDPSDFRIDGLEGNRRQSVVGTQLRINLPPHAPAGTVLRIWGPGQLGSDGRSVLLTGAGPMEIEVWSPGPGRLLGTELKPWIVTSPIWVRPA